MSSISIRLSKKEREKLEELALEHGMTISQYIRAIINGKIVRQLSEQEVAEYIERLYKTMV